ncbi:c-type cytochrome [Paenibacillus eucommiae]|uniref:Cytochrome c551 n=1 Tax=Paenibacillus eucommiae TaxID=1355755 RepID=A0ABS4IXL6_9BACL|nr:cytochrome c [Paenibacillus eucommiae]MBP1992332.1 cytochrome c551 [Paenibacillus eucommiae]
MKRYIACVIILLVFSLAACGKSSTNTPTATPGGTAAGGGASTVDAQALYKQNCMSCHGNSLEGGVGPKLQNVGAKLSKDQIATILANGKGAMPNFKGKLSDDEIGALSDWLSAKK